MDIKINLDLVIILSRYFQLGLFMKKLKLSPQRIIYLKELKLELLRATWLYNNGMRACSHTKPCIELGRSNVRICGDNILGYMRRWDMVLLKAALCIREHPTKILHLIHTHF